MTAIKVYETEVSLFSNDNEAKKFLREDFRKWFSGNENNFYAEVAQFIASYQFIDLDVEIIDVKTYNKKFVDFINEKYKHFHAFGLSPFEILENCFGGDDKLSDLYSEEEENFDKIMSKKYFCAQHEYIEINGINYLVNNI